jgi:hypothetical protein
VAVFWQGDAHKRSELPGPLLAHQAALRCAELRGIGHPLAEVAAYREILLTRLRAICGELPDLKAAIRG